MLASLQYTTSQSVMSILHKKVDDSGSLQVQDPSLPCSSDIATQLEDLGQLTQGFASADSYVAMVDGDHELMLLAWERCIASTASKVKTSDTVPHSCQVSVLLLCNFTADQLRCPLLMLCLTL